MDKRLSLEELRDLENQLSKPTGEKGIAIGKTMYETNSSMTLSSYQTLALQNHDTILEIGHGNAEHLPLVLQLATELSYNGLEISETMYKQALLQKENALLNTIDFTLYNGVNIPFNKDSFTKLITVNTIYFWQNPKEFITEIARVLHPKGTAVITFANEAFMQTLPFVKDKFTLYTVEKLVTLLKESNLRLENSITKEELVISKTGKKVNRKYTIAILKHN